MIDMQDSAIQAARKHIIFIDRTVPGYQALLDSLDPAAEVHLLDGGDGLAQIAGVLAGRSGIDAVHVLSHGAPGTLQLGGLSLTAGTLEQRGADMAAIRAALSGDADLLLYGCDAAAGSAGAALVDTLARLTGADVAASTGPTGAAVLGGDWVLESSSGPIEAQAIGGDGALAGYAATLAAPVTFTFDTQFSADQTPGAPGVATATQLVSGHLLTVTAPNSALVIVPEGTFTANNADPVMNGNVLAVDWSDSAIQLPTTVRMQLDSGKVFTLSSFSLINTTGLAAIRVTTDKGYVDFPLPFDADGHVHSTVNPILTGVRYAQFSDADGNPFAVEWDNIVLSDITVPPSFVGATTTLGAAQNGGAVDLSPLLHVSDTDSGETLTWSQNAAPAHGTLTLSGATAASGGADIAPGGTLTYTPAAGYAGTDSFTVQVSDGSVTATRTITVSVAPQRPGAPDLVSPSDTGASATDNVTAANAMAFTGTAAANDVTSTVRVFIDVNGNGAYNAGEATGTATVNNGGWTVSGINTSGLGSGSYNVYSIVTSASGGLTSAASTPLAITVDRTPPSVTFSGIALSADTGAPGDMITNTAAQTITATLSAALGANDVLRGSLDNGNTWTTLTNMASGTTLTWAGATLVPNGGIRLQVLDEHGNAGPATTKAYTLDTAAPAQTVVSAMLSADSGASASDFVTNTAAQTISGTLSGATASGEFVEVSLNNGSTWTTAANTTGTSGWSLAGQTLAGSGTMQVRVTDAAGNRGTAFSQAYVIDTAAPTATVPAGQDLVAPSGSSFTFTVNYADALAGIDPGSFGTGNVTVTDAQNNKLGVTGFAVSGNEVTYTAQAPGGSWDVGDVGAYTVGVVAGSVRDNAGNGIAGNASAGTFNVVYSTAPSVSQLALSADTGISNSDFVTKTASQTVTATLSKALDAGDKVEGSLDNGQTWTDITNKVSGTAVTWTGVTLAGSDTLIVKATDSNGQPGATASHAYTLDTTAPVQAVAGAALSADSGASASDFITNTAAQTISGSLSGVTAAGEFVEVSLDNGTSWTTAAHVAGTDTWALAGQSLAASGTLQVRVSDAAGNHGSAWTQAWRVDTAAPTAATPVRADLVDAQGGSFTFTVTYADSGAGLDLATIGTDDVAVTGPAGALTVSGASASGNTVTYTVAVPGGSWDEQEAGDYTIGLTGAVDDLAGNALAANPAAHTFHVGFRPTATIAVLDNALTAGETTTVTITFSRAVVNFDVGDLTVPNGTLSQLASTDGGVTWTATLTPAANAWATSNSIVLNLAGVTSADGTPGTGTAQSNSYAVQTGSAPGPGPEQPTGTVDGVPVTSTQQTDPGTGLVNNTVSVPIVTSTRSDDPNTPNAALADIPLAATKGAAGAALTVSPPVGTGLDVSGPATLLTGQEALLDLIRRIEQKTAAGSDVQQQMTGEGTAFLGDLLDDVLLQTATVTPTAAAGAPRSILISGGSASGTAADATARGIVIDARQLPGNVQLQLDNVEFAAVVGNATLRGGTGANIVIGDNASQSIYLGEGDDKLSGGGGDDVIGSAGGNDLLSGDSGNDTVAGGIGHDSVLGGTGDDVLQGGRSTVGRWEFTMAADGALSAGHQTRLIAPALSETLARTELDQGADALAFLSAQAPALRDIALLYHAAFGRAADLPGLNFYIERGEPLSAIAGGFVRSAEWSGSVLDAATDNAFVQALYQQVLGRAGEAQGVSFWLGKLAGSDGPALSRADVLLAFATSAEHRAHYANGLVIAQADVTTEQGWIAGSGDDRLVGGSGNDLLIGGDGTDTAVFAGKQAEYGLLVTGNGRLVLANAATGEADTFSGIERGEFGDGTLDLAFTQGPRIETLGLLYQSVLDRAADLPGIAWWSGLGLDTAELAAGFAGSAEFQQRYGSLSDTAFVQALYANSGLAATAAGGTAGWVSYLEQHTRAELIGAWIGQHDVIAAQFTTPIL